MTEAAVESPSNLQVAFQDENFLRYGPPLNAQTVLDYIVTSPFYQMDCNNERCRLQGLDMRALATLTGVEYVARAAAPPHDTRLFIIERRLRRSADDVVVLSCYYCLDGIVYQAPDLYRLAQSRAQRAAEHLSAAMRHLRADQLERADGKPAAQGSSDAEVLYAVAQCHRILNELDAETQQLEAAAAAAATASNAHNMTDAVPATTATAAAATVR